MSGVPLPKALSLSDKLYRRLLAIYPAEHRREYGPLMAQLFRDQCRDAYGQEKTVGVVKLWLRVLGDLGATVGSEHVAEFRRSFMGKLSEKLDLKPQGARGMWAAILLVAAGVVAKIIIVQAGGSVMVATVIAIAVNLLAAVILEFTLHTRGATIAASSILIGSILLPLLWVEDAASWLRENPINAGIVVIASLITWRTGARWPLFAVAIVLGAMQIVVSFI